MEYLNLVLAVFWLALGAGLVIWHAQTGSSSLRLPLGGQSFSAGWVALALAGYNLIRWWMVRARVARRRAERDAEQRRRDELRARRVREEPPDPTFDFSDPPEGQGRAGGG